MYSVTARIGQMENGVDRILEPQGNQISSKIQNHSTTTILNWSLPDIFLASFFNVFFLTVFVRSDLHTKTSIRCVFNILTAIQQSSETSKSNARFSYLSAFSPVLLYPLYSSITNRSLGHVEKCFPWDVNKKRYLQCCHKTLAWKFGFDYLSMNNSSATYCEHRVG